MKSIQIVIDAERQATHRLAWVSPHYFPSMSPLAWTLQGAIGSLKKRYGQIVVSAAGFGNRVFDGVPVVDGSDCLRRELKTALRLLRPQHLVCHISTAAEVVEIAARVNARVIVKLTESSLTQAPPPLSSGCRDVRFFCQEQWIAHRAWSTWGIRPALVNPIVLPWVSKATYEVTREHILYLGNCAAPAGRAAASFAARQTGRELLLLTDVSANTQQRMRMPHLLYASACLLVVDARSADCVSHFVLGAILNEVPVLLGGEECAEEWHEMVVRVDNPHDELEWEYCIQDVLCHSSQVGARRLRSKHATEVGTHWQSADSYSNLLS